MQVPDRLTPVMATAVGLVIFFSATYAQVQPPAGFPGMPPDMAEMFQERKVVAQFDASKDGRLDRAERQAAREWLATQPAAGLAGVIGRFGGPGGLPGGPPGAPPGLPPGMPPFGGPGFAPSSPGPRVSPDAVRTFRDEPLYDKRILRTLFLQFENADWEKELEAFYNTDVEVPAVLTVDGRAYRDVGVHFRGLSSFAFVPAGSKRSLNLSVDFVDDKQRVLGYRTLNLLNANGDPTFMRAPLYSEIASRYLPTARVNFVRLVINGESWGIYLNAEQFNSDFVRDRFKSSRGARWKVPGSPMGRGGFQYLGEDIAPYRSIYEIKTRDDERSWRQLIRTFRVLNETPLDRLESELAPLLDIDGALKFLAVEVALVNSDGYWSRASDYNIYLDEQSRVHVLPHDINEGLEEEGGGPGRGGRGGPPGGPGGFQLPPGIQLPPGFQFPAMFGQAGAELDPLIGLDDTTKPLRSKLLAVPALRTRYLGYVREIADTWLDWRTLEPMVRQYQSLIAADVKADTRKLYPYEQFESEIDRGDSSLKSFVDRRRAFLLKNVPAQGAR